MDEERLDLQRRQASWVRRRLAPDLARIRAATEEELILATQQLYLKWVDHFGSATEELLGPYPTQILEAAKVAQATALIYVEYRESEVD